MKNEKVIQEIFIPNSPKSIDAKGTRKILFQMDMMFLIVQVLFIMMYALHLLMKMEMMYY